MVKDSSNLYFSNKLQEMKRGSKKQLKPLYLASSSKKDRNEIVLDSMSNNTKNNPKATSSTISKQKKTNNVFPTQNPQNYNNINKSHLNNILNDSNMKDEKPETSRIQNSSMVESQLDVAEKTQTVIDKDNSVAVDNNEKITENASIKKQQSVKESVKESIKESVKEDSIKETSENNVDTMSKKEKTSEAENMQVIEEDNEKDVKSNTVKSEVVKSEAVKSVKEIVEEENEGENEDDKELEIPESKKEVEEEAADGEDE
jgi:hypothetical protein